MRIVVVAVGRLKPPWSDDVEHYRRLLGRHVRLELVEVREDDRAERRIPPDAFTCLLEKEGDALDSPGWAGFIEQRRQSGRDLGFVVGGPFGITLPACDRRISFGPPTLPHQLARVVLLEQLYRAHKIIANEPYHH